MEASPASPLFYQSIIPLNRESHRDMMIVDKEARYGFARKTHVIPAVIDEFTTAFSHLPIVFAPASPFPTPVFLVGVRPSQNLLVDDDGRWTAGYIPAFIRRYPFMRGAVNSKPPITCVDEKSDLFNRELGSRLFDENGSDTPVLKKYIELVDGYYISARRTEEFLGVINELDLLRQVTIEAKIGGGNSAIVHGFLTVDEEKLNALPQSDFLRLRAGGFLSAIYAHLFSLRSVDLLRKVIVEASAKDGSKTSGGTPIDESQPFGGTPIDESQKADSKKTRKNKAS